MPSLNDLMKKMKDKKPEVKPSSDDVVRELKSESKSGQKFQFKESKSFDAEPIVDAPKKSASASDDSSNAFADKSGVGEENIPSGQAVELKDIENAKKTLIKEYGRAKIYDVEGQYLLHYTVPVPRPTVSEKSVINTIKEAATRIISIEPYKIRNVEEKRNVYFNKVLEILRDAKELAIPERRFEFYADAVVREMVGYGLIDDLIRDDKLEEIMIIGPNKPVYVYHREFEMMTTNIVFFSDSEVQDLINRIARQIGRRVDISAPLLDARLPDGSRVNATIPPASVSGSTLTIRKFREDPYTIVDLIKYGTLGLETAAFLWLAVEGLGVKPANILISGGTGSGKTTLLNVLSSMVPETERVLSIEDTAELNLPLKHWIRMEGRPPGLEGKGEITLDVLTKNSLRMRPDRIIVGEVRHAEAFSLFTAMNTGHSGSMGTIHANSPDETVIRVTSPPMDVPELMVASLDLIVIEHRLHDRKKGTIRRVTEIAEVLLESGGTKLKTQNIFERDAVKDGLERTKAESKYLKQVQLLTGYSKKDIDDELAQREKVLKSLLDKGVRDNEEVSKVIGDFIDKQKKSVKG